MAELGLADLMAVARTKLMAALPAGARGGTPRIAIPPRCGGLVSRSRMCGHASADDRARAVWNARYLRFRYGQAKDSDWRKGRPTGSRAQGRHLVPGGAEGELDPNLPGGKDFEAEALDEPYARPTNFDLAAWWARSRANMK